MKKIAASVILFLSLLPFFALSQYTAYNTAALSGNLYGEVIVAGPLQLTSGCDNNLSAQIKFVATAKSIYQADLPNLPNSYSKKWAAPTGRRITSINVKKQAGNGSCWAEYLLILLDNGGVYMYNPASNTAVSYGQAGSGNAQSFFKIGGDNIDHIYVLSSSYLYATSDSGAHWIVDTIGLNSAFFNDFAIDSSQRVYAATSVGLFTKLPSDNAWAADTFFTALEYIAKVFIDRQNRIFVAGGGNELIFTSFSGDTGWVADSINFGPYVVKEFADDDSGNIYAVANTPITTTGDKIFKSDSGTGAWQEIDGLLTLWNANPVFINSISGDSVLNLGTNFGIYISPDLGNTWPQGNNTGIQAEEVSGLGQLQNGRLIIAVSLGVYTQSAAGANWQQTYPTSGYGNNITIYPDGAGNIYLLDPNITPYLQQAPPVLKSTDGGNTWLGDTVGLSPVSGTYYYVDETGTQHYGNTFFSNSIYTLLWARPAGGNWAPDTVDFPVTTNSAITAMASDNAGYLYVSGYLHGGGVWRRPIATGSAWQPDTAGLNSAYVTGFYQMAGGDGKILGSTSYQIFMKIGANWSNVPFPPQCSGYKVSAISVDTKGNIFAAFTNPSGTGAGVYASDNSGATWYSVGLNSLDITSLVSYTDTTYALTSGEWAYMISLPWPLGISTPSVNALPFLNTYPEPFNNIINIQYSLPVQSFITIKVYDIAGQEIGTLKNETDQAGSYILNWNAEALPDGIYLCKMIATGIDGKDYSSVARMVHLK